MKISRVKVKEKKRNQKKEKEKEKENLIKKIILFRKHMKL